MQLGNNGCIKINVVMYKKRFNSIEHMYKEYEYYSDDHHQNMVSMSLHYDYFLSVENMFEDKALRSKGFLLMRYPELYIFKTLIDNSIIWFLEERFNDLFFIKDGILQVNKAIRRTCQVAINAMTTVTTEPIVVDTYNKGKMTGIRLTFTSNGHYIDIDIDSLFGLKLFLDRCDLFAMAQNLVNFVNAPKFGTNRVNMNPVQSQVSNVKTINNHGRGLSGRQIGDNKSNIEQLE